MAAKRNKDEPQSARRVFSPLVKKDDHQGFKDSFMKSKKQANRQKTFKTQRISARSSSNGEAVQLQGNKEDKERQVMDFKTSKNRIH